MVSRRLLGAVAVAGFGAGFALALPAAHPPSTPAAPGQAEVQALYHQEVALDSQATHLQQLLAFSRAVVALHPAVPTPAASPTAPIQLIPSPPAASSGAGPAPVVPAVTAPPPPPPTTTTTEPPETTTTEPPETTTTTRPPTTTTTFREDD
jgi:hypothetical protein